MDVDLRMLADSQITPLIVSAFAVTINVNYTKSTSFNL